MPTTKKKGALFGIYMDSPPRPTRPSVARGNTAMAAHSASEFLKSSKTGKIGLDVFRDPSTINQSTKSQQGKESKVVLLGGRRGLTEKKNGGIGDVLVPAHGEKQNMVKTSRPVDKLSQPVLGEKQNGRVYGRSVGKIKAAKKETSDDDWDCGTIKPVLRKTKPRTTKQSATFSVFQDCVPTPPVRERTSSTQPSFDKIRPAMLDMTAPPQVQSSVHGATDVLKKVQEQTKPEDDCKENVPPPHEFDLMMPPTPVLPSDGFVPYLDHDEFDDQDLAAPTGGLGLGLEMGTGLGFGLGGMSGYDSGRMTPRRRLGGMHDDESRISGSVDSTLCRDEEVPVGEQYSGPETGKLNDKDASPITPLKPRPKQRTHLRQQSSVSGPALWGPSAQFMFGRGLNALHDFPWEERILERQRGTYTFDATQPTNDGQPMSISTYGWIQTSPTTFLAPPPPPPRRTRPHSR